MRSPRVSLCILTTICTSAPVNAQVVRGHVVEGVSGAPVRTAVVSLLASDSTPTGRRTLTDAAGAFALSAPSAGPYVIEVRSIGFRRLRQRTDLRAGGAQALELRLTRTNIALSSVRVEGKRNCRPPDFVASTTADMWDDVWAALSATVLADPNASARSAAFRYRRDVDAADGRVMSERRDQRDGPSFALFEAAAPRDLARRGFLHEDDVGNLEIYAPDARTFVSPEFIAGHCFAATRDDSSSAPRVGIAFWPQRSWATRGIEGVFWLDPATRELRNIEFTYPGLSRVARPSLRLGGAVSFSHNEDGAWFVSRWHIRAPVIQRQRRWLTVSGRRVEQDPIDSVATISEEGGIVVTNTTRLASVRGTVVDADGDAPLAGSLVELLGTSFTTTVDSAGRFALTSLLPGRYAFRVMRTGSEESRAIWSVGVLDVHDGAELQHNIRIANEQTLARTACSPSTQRSLATVALHGVVRDARTGAPLAGRSLDVQWLRFLIEGRSQAIVQRRESQELTTDGSGALSTCRIPSRADIALRDANARAASWSAPVRLGEELTVLDIGIDSSDAVVRVDGGLRIPVFKALIADDRRTAVDRARTADTMTVRGDDSTTRRTRLTRTTPILKDVVVTGEADPMSLGLRDFRDRERAGLGKFISPEALARAGDVSLSSFVMSRIQGFAFVPLYRGTLSAGLGIASRRFGSIGDAKYQKSLQPTQPPPCFAQVFVDGARVSPGLSESWDITPLKTSDILAMEFYRGASETPTQFSGPTAACGTVVIWMQTTGTRK